MSSRWNLLLLHVFALSLSLSNLNSTRALVQPYWTQFYCFKSGERLPGLTRLDSLLIVSLGDPTSTNKLQGARSSVGQATVRITMVVAVVVVVVSHKSVFFYLASFKNRIWMINKGSLLSTSVDIKLDKGSCSEYAPIIVQQSAKLTIQLFSWTWHNHLCVPSCESQV